MLEIKIRREAGCEDIALPEYKSEGASGMDLPAAVEGDTLIHPGEILCVSTGLRMAIPAGYEGQVRPRSGLALKHGVGVLNAPGTIDSDYRGVIGVILINLGTSPFTIRRGDRIAQLVIAPVARVEIKEAAEIENTTRNSGGFGHTGIC
ncbi:dUTP diphosphatase [Candidatus Sumerlaeota bacterium]|nr:dUTP diphosphatase [Candidatus Sumerlaeota bacterium]